MTTFEYCFIQFYCGGAQLMYDGMGWLCASTGNKHPWGPFEPHWASQTDYWTQAQLQQLDQSMIPVIGITLFFAGYFIYTTYNICPPFWNFLLFLLTFRWLCRIFWQSKP